MTLFLVNHLENKMQCRKKIEINLIAFLLEKCKNFQKILGRSLDELRVNHKAKTFSREKS